MRGRKPNPTALRRASGNPGKRAYNAAEPLPPEGMPDCPPHLSAPAQEEWHRLARALFDMGVLTVVDRAALAAYCQCYGRWVEAEEKMAETPAMIRTPSGYVQQSPWMSVANKQLELMGRYMAELGITPASRSRVAALLPAGSDPVGKVEVVLVWQDGEGNRHERPMPDNRAGSGSRDGANRITRAEPIYLDENI